MAPCLQETSTDVIISGRGCFPALRSAVAKSERYRETLIVGDDIFDSVVSSALGTGCRFDQGGRETKQDVTPTKHTQEPIIMLYNILKKNAFSSIFMVI